MPRIPRRVKRLIAKSRDAALLAVDVYNKPASGFRSHHYMGLMLSAWQSLFHAVFEAEEIKYYYRREDHPLWYRYVDGERQAWNLESCLDAYFGADRPPAWHNLTFFIGLRIHIDQRFLPALDLDIHGECQSLLLNYERLITESFGQRYGLGTSLAIPLQLLTGDSDWRDAILKETRSRDYQAVKAYIDAFQEALDPSIRNNPRYCFRVFLVPKIGETLDDSPVEFINYNPDKPEEMDKYHKLVAYIVEERRVPVVNPGKLKPGDVARRVREALAIKFHPSTHHVLCWKHYHIRPDNNSDQPDSTDRRYCQYDAAHNDYVYTEAWVEFLIDALADADKRRTILGD
jgi:hypothetical protein